MFSSRPPSISQEVEKKATYMKLPHHTIQFNASTQSQDLVKSFLCDHFTLTFSYILLGQLHFGRTLVSLLTTSIVAYKLESLTSIRQVYNRKIFKFECIS